MKGVETTRPSSEDPAARIAFLERQLEERATRQALRAEVNDLSKELSNKARVLASPNTHEKRKVLKRRALVIGVAEYFHLPKMYYPVADANGLADLLRRQGAEVTLLLDPTYFEFSDPGLEGWLKGLRCSPSD